MAMSGDWREAAKRAEDIIYAVVDFAPYPLQAISVINSGKANGLSDAEARRGMWGLIDMKRVALGNDWHLSIPNRAYDALLSGVHGIRSEDV